MNEYCNQLMSPTHNSVGWCVSDNYIQYTEEDCRNDKVDILDNDLTEDNIGLYICRTNEIFFKE